MEKMLGLNKLPKRIREDLKGNIKKLYKKICSAEELAYHLIKLRLFLVDCFHVGPEGYN